MLTKSYARLNYLWRVLASGLGFVIFGIGALIISLVVIPIISLTTRDKNKRQLRAQKTIHISFYFYIALVKLMGVMTTEVNGQEKLQSNEAQLLLANHPTLLDVVLLLSLLPKANCIVKQSLFKNPFLGGVVSAAGYVSNSSNPQQLITDCVRCLKQGHSLVIFPEGTRTSPGQKIKFQRAPARIAVEGNMDITPITITCFPSTLTKNKKWYQIPPHRFHMCLTIGEKIKLNSIIDKDEVPSISVRKLTRHLENYFQKEVTQYEIA